MKNIQIFLKDFFNTHGELKARKVSSPLFISGCMRSGTTFLVDKLSCHPQLLKIGVEMNAVWEELADIRMTNKCEYLKKEDATTIQLYQMANYFFYNIQKSKNPIRTLMRLWIKFKKKTGRVFYDWEQIIPMNKSTHLVNKLGYLNGLFPESKIVFIVRDIYGQSASLKKHFLLGNQTKGNFAVLPDDDFSCWTIQLKNESVDNSNVFPPNFNIIPQMWIRLNYIALKQLSLMDQNNYILVKYEDLIEDEARQFTRIFNFLNLSNQHQKKIDKISKKQITFKNTSTKGDPLKKWKQHLDESEKLMIEKAIREHEEKYSFIQEFLHKNTKH